jgi:glycosyltransferase involved in cell wall biosynthesis
VTVSQKLYQTLNTYYRIKKESISFIENGIDTALYASDLNRRAQIRKNLNFQENDYVLGFLGRLDPIKNFDLLLHIFSQCLQKDKRFKLLIIGDGSERERIQSICEQYNLQSYVTMVGQQQHVADYLQALDTLLLTSFSEQMPLSILEAMSIGIPVVAAAVGEIPYLIDHGNNGFVIAERHQPDAYLEAIFALKEPNTHERIKQAARTMIVNRFQEQKMVQNYQKLIEESLASALG